MAVSRHDGVLARVLGKINQTWPALVVLGLGLVISLIAWRLTGQRVSAEASRDFQQTTARAVEIVDRRVQDNVNLLLGLKGLFNASDSVSRREFRLYLSSFQMERRYSIIRILSYSRFVKHADRAAFERQVRADTSVDPRGYPGFAIKPPGRRDDYTVIEYLEPHQGNEIAFGLDLAADPVRRGEIERARDLGEPVASGPLAATINPNHISFSLRVAVYKPGMPTETQEQRRAAFRGVVAAVIHVDELMASLFGTQLSNDFELTVHDVGPWLASQSDEPVKQNLLYDSRFLGGSGAEAGGGPFRQVAVIDVAGRKWRMLFSLPEGVHSVERWLPMVVLVGGLLTSLLLFWIVWALQVSRSRALALAEHTRAARAAEGLREQLAFIQQLIEAVPQPIFFKDAEGRYLGVNRAWERFFGIPREQFIGKSVFELYPHDQELAKRHHAKDQELFTRPGSQSYEAAITAAQGGLRQTIYNKATFNRSDGTVAGLIGTITDVTGLKDAEAALRASERRFRDLTELSSDWYWEQDPDLRFVQMSSKIYEFSLDAADHIGRRRWEIPTSGVTEDQWQAHRKLLEERRPFTDFVYQRNDVHGSPRVISVSGRPIFDEQGAFLGYRGTGRDITEQKQVEEKIRHMAHHDALTQLPNRALLHDRIGQAIAQAQRNGEVLALLFIDLDRFKTVNDSLGHPVGDRLLQAVAGRLTGCTRGSDTIARIGGDEFVVLLGNLDRPEAARHVAQKVLDALSAAVTIDGHELKVTPSIGICAYPHDGTDVETLMRNADTAMYHAKQVGRNNYQFFTQAMNDAAQQRLLLENDLRYAIERGEFVLHYQPQLDLKTGGIVGFEALVRWRHPQRGMVPPSEFIPASEETGLIGPIGEWVLREACSQARIWHKAGAPQLQVAVNCSAQQFQREGFVETVDHILRETGMPALRLELEITESVIIHHSDEVNARFQALGDMGVRISIDDFGTGYSSLSYLKRLAIHQLKIDQSFVRDISSDPDDAAIVSAIIAIAHSLDLDVVAEGVETSEQLAFLRSLGCDAAQGYLFSKPLPAEEFGRLLVSWNPQARAVSV
jgi:diguanylate cyclase (GGDEF)-like protein/PAS domain S-box-containing protein